MYTAFLDGVVFVGDGRVLEGASVLVDGKRIVKVSKGNLPAPKGARKIPLSGRTLFPGFIDCHVHFCLDGSPYPAAAAIKEDVSTLTLKQAEFARRTLSAGVTTVRILGGIGNIDFAIRDAIKTGLIPGPRTLISGRKICITGGQSWRWSREADGPAEVMKASREQIRAGADVVKFMATGGVMTPGVEPSSEEFTEEELRAGIHEAHKAGKKTAAHAQGLEGALNAVRAGIDSIEHGFFLNEDVLSLMAEKGVSFIPTLSVIHNIERKGIAAGIPSFGVEKALKAKSSHLNSVRLAREAKVRVAMGTDAGNPFTTHGENLEEIVLMVEAGFTPMEALQSATKIAAKALGLENELGTIEEGKLADLVIVEGNPLEDINLLLEKESIRLVMQDGKLVKGKS